MRSSFNSSHVRFLRTSFKVLRLIVILEFFLGSFPYQDGGNSIPRFTEFRVKQKVDFSIQQIEQFEQFEQFEQLETFD